MNGPFWWDTYTGLGYYSGVNIEDAIKSQIKWSNGFADESLGMYGMTKYTPASPVPGISGSVGGSLASELTNYGIGELNKKITPQSQEQKNENYSEKVYSLVSVCD
ncbi:MAG: hypothetical protein P4L95_07270 [Rouxiella aceris]|uniref:hypothetical protein n=1 Tax=Rouxiella aceris TaxID=2703884 RepID=UPI0028507687|nr:hypothetical protein [Rouxiella aceris]MDR3431691.1 hypothetical protein [Rouxiella aceris]